MENGVETWRAVVGHEGRYEVSDHGNVRSLNYNRRGRMQLLRPTINPLGYRGVDLNRDGKRQPRLVPHLVAIAFVPNPDNLKTVDHKNRDRADDRAVNLRWADRSTQSHNQNRKRNNTSGIKGISWIQGMGRWQAKIHHKGETYRRIFRDISEAIGYLRATRDFLGIGDVYNNPDLDAAP